MIFEHTQFLVIWLKKTRLEDRDTSRFGKRWNGPSNKQIFLKLWVSKQVGQKSKEKF